MDNLDKIDIASLTEDVDNAIVDLCMKYEIDTFLMTGVILARLTLCAEHAGYMEDFKGLLEGVNERCEITQSDTTVRSVH